MDGNCLRLVAAISTSVDQGTALELAGTGKVDCGSLYGAIELAVELASK